MREVPSSILGMPHLIPRLSLLLRLFFFFWAKCNSESTSAPESGTRVQGIDYKAQAEQTHRMKIIYKRQRKMLLSTLNMGILLCITYTYKEETKRPVLRVSETRSNDFFSLFPCLVLYVLGAGSFFCALTRLQVCFKCCFLFRPLWRLN